MLKAVIDTERVRSCFPIQYPHLPRSEPIAHHTVPRQFCGSVRRRPSVPYPSSRGGRGRLTLSTRQPPVRRYGNGAPRSIPRPLLGFCKARKRLAYSHETYFRGSVNIFLSHTLAVFVDHDGRTASRGVFLSDKPGRKV